MTPQEQAAAILNHYMEQLARRSGLRWTERNRADIEQAAQLLSADADDQDADCIPPYQPQEQERVTISFERNPADDDPNFRRWRQERYSDTEQARRMLERERRHV
jgi:hypothetical protein